MIFSKNIIVTGGLGTIGSALIKQLVSDGHRVVSSDLNNCNITQKKFYNQNSKLFFYKTDITNQVNIKNLIKFSLKKLHSIDVVLHCAYPKKNAWGKKLNEINQKNLNKNLSNHLGGTIILSKLFIDFFLKEKKQGKIILFSSIYGFSTPRFEDYPKNKVYSPLEYGAIKAGIISITKYLAKFYKNKKININCVSPGGIKDTLHSTNFTTNYRKHCNAKGLLDANDLIGLIEFLLSEKSKMINGQNITIDDGWSL